MLYINLIIFTAIIFITFFILYLEWGKFSKIYHTHYDFFDIFFMIIYPLEESLFLFLYYLDDPLKRSLWVSLIVIIICLTVVIDKFLLKKQNTRAINMWKDSQEKIIDDQDEIIDELLEALTKREEEKCTLIKHIKTKQKKSKKNMS